MPFFETAALIIWLVGLTATTLAVVYIAYLTLKAIVKWCKAATSYVSGKCISFLMSRSLNSGNNQVIRGVLNKSTQQLIAGEIVNTPEVEYHLRKALEQQEVVII